MLPRQMAAETTPAATSNLVGFCGCSDGVVRLSAREATTGEELFLPKCPCCGHGHTVKPFWRRWIHALDAGRPSLQVTGAYDLLHAPGACTRG